MNSEQPIQYAALIPDASEQQKLMQLVELAAQTPGFKPIDPRDAHVTVGFNPDGFDDEGIRLIKQVKDVELQSAAAQGLQRKHGNLHLIYMKNTKQIGVAIEFPSHAVNEIKAKLKHTFDGRLSVSHMTIGVLDPQALGLKAEELQALAEQNDYEAIQSELDTRFSALLTLPEAEGLKEIAEDDALALNMAKVHASPHTECPLDITEHPNPISTRENALDQEKENALSAPVQTLSGWVEHLLGSNHAANGMTAVR